MRTNEEHNLEIVKAARQTKDAVMAEVRKGCCQSHVLEKIDDMASAALATSLGVFMGFPKTEMVMTRDGQNSDHVLIYVNVERGKGKTIAEGFVSTVEPFLVPGPLDRYAGARAEA